MLLELINEIWESRCKSIKELVGLETAEEVIVNEYLIQEDLNFGEVVTRNNDLKGEEVGREES